MKNPFVKYKENPVFLLESGRIKNGTAFIDEKINYLSIILKIFFILISIILIASLDSLQYHSRQIPDYGVIFTFAWFFFTYLAIARAVSLMAYDKERKIIEPLRTTLLRPEDIIWGKFWAAFYPLFIGITIFYFCFTQITVIQQRSNFYEIIGLIFWLFHLLYTAAAILITFNLSYNSTFHSKHYTYPVGLMLLLYYIYSLLWSKCNNGDLWDTLRIFVFEYFHKSYFAYNNFYTLKLSTVLGLLYGMFLVYVSYKMLLKKVSEIPDK